MRLKALINISIYRVNLADISSTPKGFIIPNQRHHVLYRSDFNCETFVWPTYPRKISGGGPFCICVRLIWARRLSPSTISSASSPKRHRNGMALTSRISTTIDYFENDPHIPPVLTWQEHGASGKKGIQLKKTNPYLILILLRLIETFFYKIQTLFLWKKT